MMAVESISDWRTFVKAGKAIFTIENVETGNRFTFRVTRHHNSQGSPTRYQGQEVWWVSVLSGPDNTSHYSYMGMMTPEEFRTTQKSRVQADAPSFKVFTWLHAYLFSNYVLPSQIRIHHEGRCGRCGRRLTVPESIDSGFGPECIHLIGKGI